MYPQRLWFVASLIPGLVGGMCHAQMPTEATVFPEGIILIGTQRLGDSDGCSIEVISAAGERRRSILRHDTGFIHPSARLSRQGNRLVEVFAQG